MTILVQLENDSDKINALLGKDLPSYRQAYSDRTAWLMACLSELAYMKFNPLLKGKKDKEKILDVIKSVTDKGRKDKLAALIGLMEHDHEAAKREMEKGLEYLGLKLIETFDREGTQAILVRNDKFIALAFRGTEATSIRDIKADLKANTVSCDSGGTVHSGFNEAFNHVVWDIQSRLNKDDLKDKPLFIAGHSLGGALATIAAKRILHKGGIAACYTFGSPRVGNEEWATGIRPCIYRVVNSADCVTMVPPPAIFMQVAARFAGCFHRQLNHGCCQILKVIIILATCVI